MDLFDKNRDSNESQGQSSASGAIWMGIAFFGLIALLVFVQVARS